MNSFQVFGQSGRWTPKEVADLIAAAVAVKTIREEDANMPYRLHWHQLNLQLLPPVNVGEVAAYLVVPPFH